MSYEPLHHKYRPQTFAELVGQEAIATTLSNALRQQRIAPAYLFTGARGTGKTSSARIFAKSLNCLTYEEPTVTPCGQCEACRMIAQGTALDVIEIDAASNTGVDNIRELIERAQFAPVQCRYKVYVIDEVHMLSNAAFNALLKTLEEPPPHVVFVLATTDPQRVLPTIISRCQRFDFRRIPLEAMVQHLQHIAEKEGIPIAVEAVQLIAQISQGGLRDAESLLDQLSLLEGEVDSERVWDLVGAVPERDLLGLMQAIAQNDPETLLDRVRNLMDRGREPTIVLQNLAGFYRDLLIAKAAPERNDLVAITAQTWQEMRDFVAPLDIGLLQQGQQHLRSSEAQIRNSAQPRLWLEVTLMGLLPSAIPAAAIAPTAAPVIPPPRPVASPTAPPPTIAPAPAVAPSAPQKASAPELPAAAPPQSAPTPAPATVQAPTPTPEATPQAAPSPQSAPTAADLEHTWQQVLSLVQPNSTQILLRQQCLLLSYTGKEARIGIKAAPLMGLAKSRLSNIEAAFQQFTGQSVRVTLEVADAAARAAVKTETTTPPPMQRAAPPTPQPAPSPPLAPPREDENGTKPPPSPPPPTAASTNHTPPPSPGNATAPPASPQPASSPNSLSPQMAPEFWQEDAVTRAAKNLANFFNGQIVRMDDAADEGSESDRQNLEQVEDPDLGSEGNDVPF
ncbi:MAG: DNA polymerase III subunit gamma/tau [Cyanobacteria bacterium J06638_20]